MFVMLSDSLLCRELVVMVAVCVLWPWLEVTQGFSFTTCSVKSRAGAHGSTRGSRPRDGFDWDGAWWWHGDRDGGSISMASGSTFGETIDIGLTKLASSVVYLVKGSVMEGSNRSSWQRGGDSIC